ncbi:hypothetical protein CHK_3163 [Christensenella hongkongensis]|uniref:Uncharacterized protein n=1 Tax=Christensenella hongkongensis TaxID=270498 RepID=A0A0M2NH27_9FIRM|nr:hypothetical protein CHK_3163 [Christensenella hongkongensis]
MAGTQKETGAQYTRRSVKNPLRFLWGKILFVANKQIGVLIS